MSLTPADFSGKTFDSILLLQPRLKNFPLHFDSFFASISICVSATKWNEPHDISYSKRNDAHTSSGFRFLFKQIYNMFMLLHIMSFCKLFHCVCALAKIENEFLAFRKLNFAQVIAIRQSIFQFDILGNGWKRTVVIISVAKNYDVEKGTGNRQNGITFSEQISCDTR